MAILAATCFSAGFIAGALIALGILTFKKRRATREKKLCRTFTIM